MLIGRVTLNIPFLHCRVRASFLGLEGSPVEAHVFAVTALFNRPFLFTAHLVNGAIFSRLPITALVQHQHPDAPEEPLKALDPYGCLAEKSQVQCLQYLLDYKPKLLGGGHARYLWSIDALEGGFADSPTQHKNLHFVAKDSGSFALLPNNYLLFEDNYFTKSNSFPMPKRSTKYYSLD